MSNSVVRHLRMGGSQIRFNRQKSHVPCPFPRSHRAYCCECICSSRTRAAQLKVVHDATDLLLRDGLTLEEQIRKMNQEIVELKEENKNSAGPLRRGGEGENGCSAIH